MTQSVFTLLVALALATPVIAHEGKVTQQYDVKKCQPKMIKHGPVPKGADVVVRKDEKVRGHPVISFRILESGEVTNALVKRSSGLANVDKYALEWIRGTKFNARPGCGVIESEASVLIHWMSN
jgi:TonB family protein